MENIFLALIQQLNSCVFILLGILILGFWVIYKVGSWKEKFFHQDGEIKALKELSKEVIVIKTKVDLIYAKLYPQIPFASMSPFVLTPNGKIMSLNINADAIFRKYEPALKKEVDKLSPNTAYDIQIIAMQIAKENLLQLLTEGEIIPMKEQAYKSGILLEDVLSIFGILLRDSILKEKGIAISDVDSKAI